MPVIGKTEFALYVKAALRGKIPEPGRIHFLLKGPYLDLESIHVSDENNSVFSYRAETFYVLLVKFVIFDAVDADITIPGDLEKFTGTHASFPHQKIRSVLADLLVRKSFED